MIRKLLSDSVGVVLLVVVWVLIGAIALGLLVVT